MPAHPGARTAFRIVGPSKTPAILPSGTRSEAPSEEVLGLMKKTGCMNVTYAPESGSDRTLRELKKQVNLDHMLESIRAAKRQGIIVKCNLVIGFPHRSARAR